jgi:hypothetical protein
VVEQLPFSQACENNKGPILEVLSRVFAGRRRVLEIGSGTGQHATWFARHLPHLAWQPTDIPANLPLLRPRCAAYAGDNLLPPRALDVSSRPWDAPVEEDAIFTANSLHIMPLESVADLFAELGGRSRAGTVLAIYGPFNYRGQYTSDSNARFDQWLAQHSPHSAIRHFEEVDALARTAGYQLQEDNTMPANNRLLVLTK